MRNKAMISRLIIPCLTLVLFTSCRRDFFVNNSYFDDASFFLCSARSSFKTESNAQRFGFFSSKLWTDYEANLRDEIDVFGATPGYLLWYLQMGDAFPEHIASYNKTLGIKTVINQDLQCDGLSREQNEAILQEIVDGKWDKFLAKFAAQARDLNYPLYYRFGYEMNGDWFPWGERPQLFIEAWRHTWEVFQKAGAKNVSWVFSPSVVWGQRTFEKDILPYYPGDSYVDIVALDGYNFGDYHSRYHQWESFYKVYSGSLSGLISFNKPMWIAEIGCPSEPRRHQWLQEFLEFFDSNGCFEVFFWFNEKKDGEPDFRIDADNESLRIFREWARKGSHTVRPADELASVLKPK